jgi:hypothetical protein
MQRMKPKQRPRRLRVVASTALLGVLGLRGALALFACGGASDEGRIADAAPAKDAKVDAKRKDTFVEETYDAGSPTQTDATVDARPDVVRPTVPLLDMDLGPVIGDASVDGAVAFTVPPNTLGFNLALYSKTANARMAITSVVAPNEQAVHQNATPHNGTHATSTTFFGYEAAVAVPQSNHPQAMPTVTPGTWTFTHRAAELARARLQVQQTPDGKFHGGKLDIIVHIPQDLDFLDEGPLNAERAPNSSILQEYITGFYDAVKDGYNLDRGTVSYVTIDKRFTFLNDKNIGQAWASAAGLKPGQQALQVFISGDNRTAEFLGIAAGIPGPANSPAGATQAGIALLFNSDFTLDPASYGYVFAHEFGHFVGLNHTSEFQQTNIHDPLEDTAECALGSRDDIRFCQAATNVMFFAGQGTEVSPLQKRVVQGSPVYRAYASDLPLLVSGISSNAKRPLPQLGRLFGHPGPPVGEEALVLQSLCGSADASSPSVTGAEARSRLTQIASGSGASLVKRAAFRLLARSSP